MEVNKVYQGDNREILKTFDNETFDLTVTSPPYDNLRTYNDSLEWNFEVFQEIAKELYRVTKQGGAVVWVVGDATINGSETGTSFKQALYFKEIGFNIHDTMIYEKNGPAYPASAKSTRYSSVFEFMFVFSKGEITTVNLLKDKINRWAGHRTFGVNTERQKTGEIKTRGKFSVDTYGYRENIWRINNGYGYSAKDEIAYQHPAIFPEQLAIDHVLSWSNAGDLILDPFGGSGTTAIAAIKTNRNYILIEKEPKYVEIINKRIKNELDQFKLAI